MIISGAGHLTYTGHNQLNSYVQRGAEMAGLLRRHRLTITIGEGRDERIALTRHS